eukprot:TRINITY_DN1165_c0_g1_i1.p1 TRINITY_DN1165_c0_g1~~TRINITY_DN1165_c0_g1_i1.p1  ORF type:complete len:646 (+),score=148.76 TRINITY_DN1165_c0_g1_i1:36-1973(+)
MSLVAENSVINCVFLLKEAEYIDLNGDFIRAQYLYSDAIETLRIFQQQFGPDIQSTIMTTCLYYQGRLNLFYSDYIPPLIPYNNPNFNNLCFEILRELNNKFLLMVKQKEDVTQVKLTFCHQLIETIIFLLNKHKTCPQFSPLVKSTEIQLSKICATLLSFYEQNTLNLPKPSLNVLDDQEKMIIEHHQNYVLWNENIEKNWSSQRVSAFTDNVTELLVKNLPETNLIRTRNIFSKVTPLQVVNIRSPRTLVNIGRPLNSILSILTVGMFFEQTHHKRIVSQLLYPQQNTLPCVSKSGEYHVKLRYNGCQRQIIIDDRIPCFGGSFSQDIVKTPAGIFSKIPGELWPLLLEKACSILLSNYQTTWNYIPTLFSALYKWFPTEYSIDDIDVMNFKTKFDNDDILLILETPSLSTTREHELGLFSKQGYPVLGIRTIKGVPIFILKTPSLAIYPCIRDPVLEQQDVIMELNHTMNPHTRRSSFKGDGQEFYMSWPIISQNFSRLYMAESVDAFNFKAIHHIRCVKGDMNRTAQIQIKLLTKTSQIMWIHISKHIQIDLGNENSSAVGTSVWLGSRNSRFSHDDVNDPMIWKQSYDNDQYEITKKVYYNPKDFDNIMLSIVSDQVISQSYSIYIYADAPIKSIYVHPN